MKKLKFLFKKIKDRDAFTLIELILTMVILGIVAYVSTAMIAKTYISYNRVNTLHKANLKVELALNNIANRLSYAIPGTIVKRKSTSDTSIAPIVNAPSNYVVLEWIGYDTDDFNANDIKLGTVSVPKEQPAWSGFCDIKNSTKTAIITPGSDLSFAKNIIHKLSNGQINNLVDTALFFSGYNYNYTNVGYQAVNLSFDNSSVAIVSGIDTISTPNRFNLPNTTPITEIREHYKLAWSAYAVVPVAPKTNDGVCNPNDTNPCDLQLRFNYRPWKGQKYNVEGKLVRNRSLLVTNVTVFKTFATENRIHIKLCVKERYTLSKTTSICKEKVIFK